MRFLFDPIRKFLKKLIWPVSSIAGLEIKDAAIRIAQFMPDDGFSSTGANGNLKKAVVRLEPGIIENGRIKDRVKFLTSLKQFRSLFSESQEKIPVIVSLPSQNVYTKVFSVPSLSGKKLEEAAQLNLESISPIDLKSAYADFQPVSLESSEGKLNMLGAFISKVAADEYIQALEAGDFDVRAVEFPALAIARVVKELSIGIDLSKPQAVLNIASDGVDFMVMRKGDLYFDYFKPWKLIPEAEELNNGTALIDFENKLIQEIERIVTFYESHWGERIRDLILITPALFKEISDVLKSKFPFQIIDLKLRTFEKLPFSWIGVLGSAWRGTISRSKDTLISLMAVGTEKWFLQSEIQFFFISWRNGLLTVLSFFALLLIFTDSFLAQSAQRVNRQLQDVNLFPKGTEATQLQNRVQAFNQLVARAASGKLQKSNHFSLLAQLDELANKKIAIKRVTLNKDSRQALLIGEAKNETAVINFKNTLIEAGFSEVSLPLAKIESTPTGVSFALNFQLPR